MTDPIINDSRARLRPGEIVEYKGKFYRVNSLPIMQPTGKPGLHRVSYYLQPPLIHHNGRISFGTFRMIVVKATKIELTVLIPQLHERSPFITVD